MNAQAGSYENPFGSMEGPEDFGSMEWGEKGGKKWKKMKGGANPFGAEGFRVEDSMEWGEKGEKKGEKKRQKHEKWCKPFWSRRIWYGNESDGQ